MTDTINDLYQEVILDHSRSPRNFRLLPDANRTAQGKNPMCGDQVTVYLKVENDIIQDISFQGSGCAISKASASIMTSILKGKRVSEAQQLFDQYHSLITTGDASHCAAAKLAVFAGVYKFPARVKCAILAWHAMSNALKNIDQPVSTE